MLAGIFTEKDGSNLISLFENKACRNKPPSEEVIDPEPLHIDFSRESSKGGPALSVARLDLAGKPITSGIATNLHLRGMELEGVVYQ